MKAKHLRTKRRDRNHIVYRLDLVTTGDFYIGISGMVGRAKLKTLRIRFGRHLSKAFNEDHDWTLHRFLRKYPDPKDWKKTVLMVVRGRPAALAIERKLIKSKRPTLNTAVY